MKLKITNKAGEPFTWVRGKYEIQKINDEECLIYTGGIEVYKPDFKKIVEAIANLNEDNKSIIRFVNKYGPLGIHPFYQENGSYKSYVRSWVLHNKEVISENTSNIDLLLLWNRFFGLEGKNMISLPITRGTIISENEDLNFWNAYREPLTYLKLAIAEFKHAVKFLTHKEQHYRLKLAIELDGTTAICTTTSLIEGAYFYLVWQIVNKKKIIKECIGFSEHGCVSCEYGKRFFWANDPKQIWGKQDCRFHVKYRAEKRRSGETKKTPSRNWKKQQEAIKLHKQGLSDSQISNQINVGVDIIIKWIEGYKKKNKGTTI